MLDVLYIGLIVGFFALSWGLIVVELEPRTLLGADERRHRLGGRGFRLPEGGGRLRLGADGKSLWLDLWEGDEEGLSLDERGALAVATAMLRLALRPGPTPTARSSPGDR